MAAPSDENHVPHVKNCRNIIRDRRGTILEFIGNGLRKVRVVENRIMTQQSSSGNQSPHFPGFFRPGALSESEIEANVIPAQEGFHDCGTGFPPARE